MSATSVLTGGWWDDTGIGNYVSVETDGWWDTIPVIPHKVPWEPKPMTAAKRRQMYVKGVYRKESRQWQR